jgi:hypothetical protein
VLWVNSATNTKFVTGDVIAGPVRLNAAGGLLKYCGAPVVGIDTAPITDTQYRVETLGGAVITQTAGCTDPAVPDMSDELVGGADATLTLPVVSADDYAAIAGGMPAAAAATIVLNGSGTAYTKNGVPTPFPLNGVIVVNGPLVLSSTAPFSGSLTVVATGDITITSDLELDNPVTDMLGVVSTDGNINIEFTGTSRTIDALLFAPSLAAEKGIVQATNVSGCPEETCITSTLNIFGAIVARELGAMADVNTESGAIVKGFSQLFSYDKRFARSQPPYALSQTRGVWMRLGMSTVSPLTPGVFGVAPPTTTTTTTAAPTTTTTVPPDLNTAETNTATAPASTGTFTDSSVGLTVERTASSVSLSTTSANWDYISVTYNPGSGEVTNTVFKTAGDDVVGVLTRINNRNVTVALSSSVTFTVSVKYNPGRDTATTYVFPAVA